MINFREVNYERKSYLSFAKFNSNKFENGRSLVCISKMDGKNLNQSSEVTLNSYSVSLNSLMNYPFGEVLIII